MEEYKIIGLVGKKYSGKTSCAIFLCDEFDYINISFADPLKDILKTLFFLTDNQLNGYEKEANVTGLGISPRTLMQQIGTDLFRDRLKECIPALELQNKSIWIWHLEQRICRLIAEGRKRIVVSDIRFEDELACIKRLNGKVIHIRRTISLLDAHSSENLILAPEDVDCVIDNVGSIEDIQLKLHKIVLSLSLFKQFILLY